MRHKPYFSLLDKKVVAPMAKRIGAPIVIPQPEHTPQTQPQTQPATQPAPSK